ncbi:Neuronal acetylcholine receptor subunit like protein [Argiope bruennichi]|uniref:Neuronal acetylcholine receptor subunit like protein n=1 Tax=Argiope bruennichi TaxID=94029 RepID=A0A8T0E788_ARGBR|nr:Neuronal acetylcholine receptor subunit like protein [Argiope bruennichi]
MINNEDFKKAMKMPKENSSPLIRYLTQISVIIILLSFLLQDEKNQVLTTNVWLDQEWMDDYLSWNPAEFGNLTKIRIPCEKIWLPDIVLYNNADDYTRGYMNSRAMLEPSGNVFWPPPTKFRSTCPVDVTYFPFDDQTCIMKMGSWIYDGLQVDVMNRTSEVDLSNYVPNGEWELLDARIVRNVVYYSCCSEPFPDVTITLVIRRKTLYYMYNVVMPCMMMSVLTLLVFCLPPDSGEKIALGVTVLLAFSVFMLAIAEKMPETSESIPLLGIYLTVVMAITSISVVVTVVVLNFHYRGPSRKEVPPYLRELILHRFASCSCYKSAGKKAKRTANTYDAGIHPPSAFKGESFRLTIDSLHEELKEMNSELTCNEPIVCSSGHNVGDHSSNKRRSHGVPSSKSQVNGSSPGSGCTGSSSGTRIQAEILRTLQYLLYRQEQEDHRIRVIDEWRQMALVIDRILFWIFFVVTVVSSLSFLVIVPLHRRGLQFT